MPYAAIALDTVSVPEPIRYFVALRVEPYLRDVRLMLEYPKRPAEPGFNLTAASALFSVMGGLSRIFYNSIAEDRLSFQATAKRYSMQHEPANATRDPETFADRLYIFCRCNLVHSLGFNMEKLAGRWTIRPIPSAKQIKVTRWPVLPLGEDLLTQLDLPSGWPSGLPATLSDDADAWRLNVDALYCGVRRLVRTLAEDKALHAEAVQALKPWYDGMRTPLNPRAVQSGTNLTYTQTVDATLGAVSQIFGFWNEIKDDDPNNDKP